MARPPGEEGSIGFVFAFQALPAVIFFSALVGLLYHWGIMTRVVRGFSKVFTKLMRISGAESLGLSSNIFVSIESALTIRPFLPRMTRSELMLILTAGMATVASTVLGLYVMMLNPVFPQIAGHLVSASLLSAPAALLMAKTLVPEEGKPETLGIEVRPVVERRDNWVEAVTQSSLDGWKLALGIATTLIAFLGLLGLLNGLLDWTGGWAGVEGLTWQGVMAWLFVPFAWLMGVAPADVSAVAELLALRLFATEVPAYQEMAVWLEQDRFHSARSAVIAAYALCGFAHFASMGIFVGGMAALEPSRAGDLGRLGLRALLAATLACFMTGSVAGVFAGDGVFLWADD